MSARILIIEDDPGNMEAMVWLLEGLGYVPVSAEDGVSGVKLARQCRPDLIICGVLLAGFDGYGVLAALKGEPALREIPVLAMRHQPGLLERENLLAAGFDGCVALPIDADSFAVQLGALLAHVSKAPAVARPFVSHDQMAEVLGELESSSENISRMANAGHAGKRPEELVRMSQQLSCSLASLQAVSLRLTALIDLGIDLAGERDPNALLAIGCRVAQNICVAKYACIGVLEEGAATLSNFAFCGTAQTRAVLWDAPRVGVLAELLEQRLPVRRKGLAGEAQLLGLPPQHLPVHSFLGVPLVARERVHGWLYLVDKLGADGFADVDERVAVTVASQIAVAYENLLLYADVQAHHARLSAELAARAVLDEELLRFRTAMDATGDAIFLIDRDGPRFVDVNAAACRLLGVDRSEFLQACSPAPEGGEPCHLHHLCVDLIADEANGNMLELVLTRHDGVPLSFEVARRAMPSCARRIVVAVARDVTERVETAQRMLQLAHFDALTGLLNRSQFSQALRRTIDSAREHRRTVAVLFMDADRFKNINDTLGHAAGDDLLRQFSSRLVDTLRVRDIIGRFGGDEFAAMLVLPDGPQNVITVVDKIREVLRHPFVLSGHEVTVTASIGIAVFPDDTDDADTLIKCAGIAMQRAKEAGRDAFRYYTAQMNDQSLARLELETALRHGIENEEFELHYQPKVAIGSGRISGAEALIRWNRPGHGVVSPGLFIPILEETGLIVRVGNWVLKQACRQIGIWNRTGVGSVQVSVNVSGIQFFAGGLEQEVLNAIRENDIAPELLELELTESSLMSNAEETIAVLRNLKALGVKISIDDFGTGYSSLAYLKRFPIDKLKIDIAFVREVTSNPDDAAIVLAIISMAHSLKLQVVAEGVEKDAQLAYLRRHGCDEMQGYYFSRPVGHAEFATMMRDGKCLPEPADESSNQQQTLLIVDDDTSMLNVLSDFLSQDGYRILTAQAAEEGFDMLARHRVQVILCDQCMPRITGTEFMKRVKDLCPDTFRIVLSAHADLTPIMEAVNQGAVDRFYTKPWKGAVLRENVREGFRLHGLQYRSAQTTG